MDQAFWSLISSKVIMCVCVCVCVESYVQCVVYVLCAPVCNIYVKKWPHSFSAHVCKNKLN